MKYFFSILILVGFFGKAQVSNDLYVGNTHYHYVKPFTPSEELSAILTYAEANSYTPPSNTSLLDNLIKELKDEGIWQKLDLFYVFAGDGSTGFKLINIVNPDTFYPTAFGGFTWANNGLKGNGSNAYLTTGFNPNIDHANYTLNNASRGGVITTQTGYMNFDGVAGVYRNDFNGSTIRFNSETGISLSYWGDGLVAFSRNNSTTMEYTLKEIESEITVSTNAATSEHIQVIFRRHNSYSSIRLGCYFMGGYLTATERRAFRTAFNNYLTSIGETPL